MHGLATLFVRVLWRIGDASKNGWWKEQLHLRRFAEWMVGDKNKKQCEEEQR